MLGSWLERGRLRSRHAGELAGAWSITQPTCWGAGWSVVDCAADMLGGTGLERRRSRGRHAGVAGPAGPAAARELGCQRVERLAERRERVAELVKPGPGGVEP